MSKWAVVDSCGWLEVIKGAANKDFFLPVLARTDALIVPTLVVYEVCRHLATQSPEHVQTVYGHLCMGKLMSLNAEQSLAAALAAKEYGLHLSDAIIWQTAQSMKATLYTQDTALKDLPGVKYQIKPRL